jgi:hypothetical protein
MVINKIQYLPNTALQFTLHTLAEPQGKKEGGRVVSIMNTDNDQERGKEVPQ